MKNILFYVCLVQFAFFGVANAEALDVLIQEEAAEVYGSAMPDNGTFDVLLQTNGPKEAVVISAFWMDRNTGQFVANAATKDGKLKRVKGMAILSIEVPVPARRILPDEIITAQDIVTERLPYARVGSYAVTNADDVIGKQVQRLLPKGRPIMMQSIIDRLIIDRGDKVEIRYSDGPITLTAPGRALADASQGQEIKIVNLVGNTILVGIASAEGIVEIIR